MSVAAARGPMGLLGAVLVLGALSCAAPVASDADLDFVVPEATARPPADRGGSQAETPEVGSDGDDDASSSPEDAGSAVGVGERWTRVAHDPGAFGPNPDAGLHDPRGIAVGASGLVMVGTEVRGFEPANAVVWTSVDGLGWERVAHDPSVFAGEGMLWMLDVTAGGPGFVAVGRDWSRDEPAVWASEDGTTWTRIDRDALSLDGGRQWMTGVTAGGPGLVAVGTDLDSDAGVLWTSPDGQQWTRVSVEDDAGPRGATRLTAVAAGPQGLVAIGTAPDRVASVWTSADGSSWTRVEAPEAVFGPGQLPWALTVGGPGFVAVGEDEVTGVAVVWTSPDGVRWDRVPHDDAVFGTPGRGATMLSVTHGAAGLVAVGYEVQGAVSLVWFSPDGLQWRRLPDRTIAGSDVQLRAVAAGGAGFVAVGRDHTQMAAAVWTSP